MAEDEAAAALEGDGDIRFEGPGRICSFPNRLYRTDKAQKRTCREAERCPDADASGIEPFGGLAHRRKERGRPMGDDACGHAGTAGPDKAAGCGSADTASWGAHDTGIPIMTFAGDDGSMALYRDGIGVSRRDLLGYLALGMENEAFFPYAEVEKVAEKNAGVLDGYLRVRLARNGRRDRLSELADARCVTFSDMRRNRDAERFARAAADLAEQEHGTATGR